MWCCHVWLPRFSDKTQLPLPTVEPLAANACHGAKCQPLAGQENQKKKEIGPENRNPAPIPDRPTLNACPGADETAARKRAEQAELTGVFKCTVRLMATAPRLGNAASLVSMRQTATSAGFVEVLASPGRKCDEGKEEKLCKQREKSKKQDSRFPHRSPRHHHGEA